MKHIPKLLVLIGPSGSGKTEFARKYIRENPRWARVSRDDLRAEILGWPEFGAYFKQDNSETEKHVTNLQMEKIRYWLTQGWSVIVDNTHLKSKYLEVYRDSFNHLAEIHYVPFKRVPKAECKRRVEEREGGPVDTAYIDRHFEQLKVLLKEAGEWIKQPQLVQNDLRATFEMHQVQNREECILVGIDGTITDRSQGWSPYDGPLVDDVPNAPVINLLKRLTHSNSSWFGSRSPHKIPTVIYLSGREDKWQEQTLKYLEEAGAPKGHLIMRETGDFRLDHIVKTEMVLERIAPRWKVLFALDDRLAVSHGVWYKLGIFCLNVNQGLKTF